MTPTRMGSSTPAKATFVPDRSVGQASSRYRLVADVFLALFLLGSTVGCGRSSRLESLSSAASDTSAVEVPISHTTLAVVSKYEGGGLFVFDYPMPIHPGERLALSVDCRLFTPVDRRPIRSTEARIVLRKEQTGQVLDKEGDLQNLGAFTQGVSTTDSSMRAEDRYNGHLVIPDETGRLSVTGVCVTSGQEDVEVGPSYIVEVQAGRVRQLPDR